MATAQSISELAPFEALAARLHSCPGCDAPFTAFDLRALRVTVEEAAEWLNGNDLQLKIQKLPFHCNACIAKINLQSAQEAEQARLRRVLYNAYHFGSMPRDAKAETLENSSEDVMRRNEAAWMLVGKPLAKNWWIKGNPGTGKTFLAHVVANQYLDRGSSAASVKGERINEIGGLFEEKRASAMKDLKAARLLVIDDIDKPNYTPRGLDAMLHLLDVRMREKLRTIFTANTSGSWVAGTWRNIRPDNPSIAKSIMERMLPIEVIELTGESLRVS